MILCHYCGVAVEEAFHVLLDMNPPDEEGFVDLTEPEDDTGAWACSECVPRCTTCHAPLQGENRPCVTCGGDPETENYWGW